MDALFFITHPEVVIDPAVPVPEWPLSPLGRLRMERFAADPVLARVAAVISSGERKAMDGADILSRRLGCPASVDPGLGENDRSATGYIEPPAFWEVVEAFFARPNDSVRGWERAIDAQTRIVEAVSRAAASPVDGDLAIVSHGGVGCLLMAHFLGAPRARPHAQPHPGGGCWFRIDRARLVVLEGWRVIPAG